jgi:hypothetical protein
MNRLALTAACLPLLLSTSLASLDASAQSCDRDCLKGFVDGYLDALAAHEPARVPVAATYRYTENGRVITLGEGFWNTAGTPVAYRDYFLDAEAGQAAVFTAFSEHVDGVAQTMVRLGVQNRRIGEIETLVVRVGDQRWFKPEQLAKFDDVFERVVPPAERNTRAELMAAANAYFTAIETEGTPAFEQAPFGTRVNRYENGLQTTNVTENPIMERHTLPPEVQLENAFYAGTNVRNRRFPIVDTERGVVFAIATFRREGIDSNTLLLSEAFKVTSGRIREIRAVMLNLPKDAATGWPDD